MELLKNKVFWAKGKRSTVYLAEWGGRSVVVKEKLAGSGALGRMENEACWLKELNRHGIGPKFCFSGEDFVVMGYAPGERILDWMSEHSCKEIKSVLVKVLGQCRKLDELGVSKEEMHNPYKHILIKGKKVVMIDFERCHHSENPKNVRQFCQFLISGKASLMLGQKDIVIDKKKLIRTLKKYKENNSKVNFSRLLRTLNL